MRVLLDARLLEGLAGGVESVVVGLAYGLSQLDEGDEYLVYVWDEQIEWFEQYVGGGASLLSAGPAPRPSQVKQRFAALSRLRRPRRAIDRSDGAAERAGADLVHFPKQRAFLTSLPSVYHPHDLQHLHLPELVPARERRWRNVAYPTYARQAALVAVGTSWIKRDVVTQLRLPEEKVAVVPLAPAIAPANGPGHPEAGDVRKKLGLPERFVFYPAQTWPHKNHVRLLEALALLRDSKGLRVPLVCSGRKTDYFAVIEEAIARLGLERDVQFCGFVTPGELQSLYRAATATIIPSLFEAESLPLWEAFEAGCPAACSNVTSLPEQAGDAGLVFDPLSPQEIAGAIERLWSDEALRAELAERGLRNVGRFSWERTARLFQAHYRTILGVPLTDEDAALLAAPPLL